jgi:hypothetical protein
VLHCLAQILAKAVIAEVTRGDADQREVLRQEAVTLEVAQRRHEQAPH